MRSNTSVLAVFVLISSALAAPVINRPVARRSVARRSAQAILSKPAPAVCATEDANGPSWSEDLCSKMPHVTGFVEAGTDSCTRPKSVGGGTGTCYIKSDKPISRVYRRMMPVPEDAQKAPGPLSTPGATSPSSDPPVDAPTTEGPTPPGLPDGSASTTSPPDDTTSSVSAPAGPTSTSSTEAPAATPTDGPINSSQPPVIATANPDGPSKPQPNPIPPPSNSTVTPVGGTEPKDASTPPDVSLPTEDPAAAPIGPNGPDSLPPAQAPFSTPKPKSTGLPVPESVEEPVPSSSPSTDVQPAPTSSTVPAANVPIPHGTEGTWGGTLVNTINGLNSPKSGARVQAKHGTQKLSRVVGSLFFDLVYGRFLF